MTTHCAVLYIPGWPMEVATFQPKAALATLAGELRAHGHTCSLHDFGTARFLRETVSPELTADLQTQLWCLDHGADDAVSLPAAWQLRKLDTRLAEALQQACERAAREVAADAQESVVLYIERAGDLAMAVATAQALRARAPRARVVGWGPSLAALAEAIVAETGCFDCLATGSASDVVELLASPQQRDTWALVPGLAFRDGRRVRGTAPAARGRVATSGGGFSPDNYPAMAGGDKLNLITIGLASGHGGERAGGVLEPETMTPHAGSLTEEVRRVVAETGVTQFHFEGAEAPCGGMDALAHTLLNRGLTIRYSHTARVESADPATFYLLWASGCRAVDFRVDTGSQLLLDRVYRRSVGVTRVEQVLRNCRGAGITTVVGLTYPCPFDDYNTRAETVRLIGRAQPDGAYVEFPEPLPGSAWFANPTAFGFSRCSAGAVVRRWLAAQAAPASSVLLPTAPGRERRHARRTAAEHSVLRRELQDLKVAVPLDARLALMAQSLGYNGRERDLAVAMRHALLSGDATAVAGFIERFNGATAQPATAGSGPLRRLQNLAVGE